MLAKYREAFKPSRAKDDPTDAELALDLLLRHPERFSPLRPQSAGMRSLLSLIEQRRELVGDKTRFTNRLTNALKQYYPQALEWFDDIDTVLFCDFLTRWPTLPAVRRATRKTLEMFFHAHNCRRAKLVEGRLESIRCAVSLTDDPGIVAPHRLLALMLVAQLRTALAAIDVFDREIAAVARALPDFDLFDSLPGAGPHLTPRLLAALGEQCDRFRGADELQKYSGIAPATERSGKKCWVHWRWQCPTFLRQTFVEWAGRPSTNRSGRAPTTGNSGRRAARIRPPCGHWRSILYRCRQNGTRYDESIYLNTLRKRGSPLLRNLGFRANPLRSMVTQLLPGPWVGSA
jgi:transposase